MSNPYAAAAQNVMREKRAGLVIQTADSSPDESATHQALAQRTGLPVGAVRSDPGFAQREAERAELDRLGHESPTLAGWLSEPENYAVAKDDVGALERISNGLRAIVDQPRAAVAAVPRMVGSIASGIGQAYNVGVRAIDRAADAAGIPNPKVDLPIWLRPGDSFVETGALVKAGAEAIDVPEERRTLSTEISGAVGQLGAQVVQALVATPTLMPTLLAQGADQMAERAERAGAAGTIEADAAILGGAAVTGLTERYGLDKLLNRLPPKVKNTVLRRIADTVAGGGIEAAQEVTEGLAQDVLARGLFDPDSRIGEGLLREAEVAGGAGMVARMALQVLGGRRSHAAAQVEQQQLDALVGAAGESRTKGRAPERFEAMVDTLAPERMVYVPVQALEAHYVAQGAIPSERIDALVGRQHAHAEAIETGAEVAIPLARYVAQIGTDAHASLRGQVRITPGESMRPADVMPDREQIEADIAQGLAEIREAASAGGEVLLPGDRPLLTDPQQADDWAGYQDAQRRARLAQEAARMQERQAIAAAARDKRLRGEVLAEVTKELRSHPVYRAERLLRTGKGPDGSPVFGAPKLDRDAVVAAIGEERAAKLSGMLRKKNGLRPDDVAAALGYPSGAKLLHDLTTAPAFDDMLRVEVDARIEARTAPQPGDVDTVTDAKAEVLLREVQAIEARNGGVRTHDAALREVARRLIADKTAREVQPALYRQAGERAAREAYQAASKGEWRAAAAARRQQLLNLYLFREARDARAEITSAGKRFAQLSKRKAQARIGLAGGDYQEQLQALLARFDFQPLTGPQIDERTSLAKWIKAKAEQGVTVDLPPAIADEAFRVPFRKLKVGELRDLRDAVEHIVHLANEANQLRVGEQTFDRMMVDEAMALSVRKAHAQRPARTGDATLADKSRQELWKARVVMGAATDLARELDGFEDGGAVWTHTVGVIRDASDRTNAELDKAQTALAQLKLQHYTKAELRSMGERQHFPGIGDWSKGRVLSLALNWGNVGNREAVLGQATNRLTPEQVGTLLRSLDRRDWDFVQGVWSQIDAYWPEIRDTQRRRRGISPAKVDPAPFTVTLPTGEALTIPGGYFPLKYEADSVKSMRDEAADYYEQIRTGRFSKAATRDGHAIERVGSGGRTVRLELSVVDSHLRDVIRDLHLGDAVNFVHQALHGPEMGKAARDGGVVELVGGLDTWLRDVASGEMGLRTAAERGLRILRTNFTAAVLTYRATSAMLQVTGLLQSGVTLGHGMIVDGVLRYARRPVALYRYVTGASPFMARRFQTHIEAVQEVMNAEAGPWSTARAEMIRRGYWMMGRVQSAVDTVTWLAAEKQGMAKFDGDLKRARRFADDVVARAQGSGEFIDKNALQRGTLSESVRQSEYVRATTALMGYMLAKQNVAYEAVRKTNLRSVRSASKLSANLVVLFVLEGMLSELIRGGVPGDQEDDGSQVDDLLAMAAKSGAGNLFGSVPGLSQMVTEMRGYADRGLLAELWHGVAEAKTQLQQGEADKAAVKAVVKVGGLTTGLPSTQVNKTIDAVQQAREGGDVTPWEYLAGPAD